MPRGGRPSDDYLDVLSAEEIKRMRERLILLGPDGVQQCYERAFEDCRLKYGRVPSPRKMQTLVQVWKLLRKWKR